MPFGFLFNWGQQALFHSCLPCGPYDTHFGRKNALLSPKSGQNLINYLDISDYCLGLTPIEKNTLTIPYFLTIN
jgi:hypothetical protein